MSLGILLSLLVALPNAPGGSAEVPRPIRPDALRAHMRFLADDMLEGRGTATRGHEIAARYVASQLEALGLRPAGVDGSYYQRVPLRRAQLIIDRTSLVLDLPTGRRKLALGKDYVASPGLMYERGVAEARAVYLGYGISAPERGHDDYAGMDVRGKVVVQLVGAPASFPGDQRAYYSSRDLKYRTAAARGAIAILVLIPPESERRVPFARLAANPERTAMDWVEGGRPSDTPEGILGRAILSRPAAEALFSGARRSLDAAFQEAEAGKVGSFDLPAKVRLRVESRHSLVDSPNVLAVLPGSDPDLSKEHVVLSAHLDHLGIGVARKGDSIYNGAYDDASGVAAVLEVARGLAALPRRPRRSILVAAVTGEEKGLLGAEYFARHPTVPARSMVANLNVDMFLTLFPVKDIVVFGGEHSTLGAVIGDVARRLGLEVAPDPFPEETLFIRSDHYAFVREGIPSIMLSCGLKSADPAIDGGKVFRDWIANVYHSPQDDMTQAMDLESAAKIAELYLLAAGEVADGADRPSWAKGDFFAERFAR